MNIGAVIQDKYRITGILGEGAVGVVYLAEHLALDKLCAIKVLKHNLLHDQVAVERFRREALAASRLVHPNIVSVFDFGHLEGGSFFFAMDYVRGRPLNELVQGDGMDVDRACRVLRQIADALAYAHGMGVVHRDIKPDNVMLEGYPRQDVSAPRILDFGLAKFVRERLAPITVKGQLFGTPEYMAPEQIAAADVDHHADIYSFGALAFEVLTGRTPFEGGFLEQLTAHRKAPPPRPSDVRPGEIPPELDAMVLRCMEKTPADRYDSALELVAILDEVIADRAVLRSYRGASEAVAALRDSGPVISGPVALAERICEARWAAHGELSQSLYRAAAEAAEKLSDGDKLALAVTQAVIFEERARGLRAEICGVLDRIQSVRRSRDDRKALLLYAAGVLKAQRMKDGAGRSPELAGELDGQVDALQKQVVHLDREVETILAEQRDWLGVLVRRFLRARSEMSDYCSVLARMLLDARERIPEDLALSLDWSRLEELVSQSRWEWAEQVGLPDQDGVDSEDSSEAPG